MSYNDNDLVRFLLGVDGLHMARDDFLRNSSTPCFMVMVFVAGCDG